MKHRVNNLTDRAMAHLFWKIADSSISVSEELFNRLALNSLPVLTVYKDDIGTGNMGYIVNNYGNHVIVRLDYDLSGHVWRNDDLV
jgi:hypothetical protein